MVIENLLPSRLNKELYEIFTSKKDMPWYWGDVIYSSDNKEEEELNLFQFVHTVYDKLNPQSSVFPLVQTILDFFEKETNIRVKSICRIKANLTIRKVLSNRQIELLKHPDVEYGLDKNYISLIYYVNDSDGDTLIYDNNGNIKERISPEQNKLLYFNSTDLHLGLYPIKNKRRIIINFVVEI